MRKLGAMLHGGLSDIALPIDKVIAVRDRALMRLGSSAERQDARDFCPKHCIAPDVQVIPIRRVNEAYGQVKGGDVRFDYVIDLDSLEPEMATA